MSGKRILYIEDNFDNRLLIKRVLEAEGYSVVEAENGTKGLELALSAQPDLVLMDINLPDIDGYECTGRLRKATGGDKVPIVALTANAMEGDIQKAMDAGCNGYIPKPIDVDNLPRQIEKYIKQDAPVSQPPSSPVYSPPASAPSQPASTSPQPASAPSQPASTSPQPASTSPQPASAPSQPASASPQPVNPAVSVQQPVPPPSSSVTPNVPLGPIPQIVRVPSPQPDVQKQDPEPQSPKPQTQDSQAQNAEGSKSS
jgi:two-component system cell cycle response regulator DivK